MPTDVSDIMQTFPPDALSSHEHAVLAEWLNRAGDILSACVSDRRSDDPAPYRRIVIVAGPGTQPTHLIHAPADTACWLVSPIGCALPIQQFDSLRDAPNSVRDVLS